jgi:predicted transcriptional regulator
MPLIRGQHSFDGRYAQIPNFMLRDKKLSLDTIGLLAQLMSHSPGWRVSQESLAKANNVGRDSIRRMIRELVEAGYLSVSEKQVHNEKGYLAGYVYTTKDPDGMTQEPLLVEPLSAEPTKADTAHKKTNNQENNLKENKTKNIYSEDFELFWQKYPRHEGSKVKASKAYEFAVGGNGTTTLFHALEIWLRHPSKQDKTYWPYAERWLRDLRFNDELPPVQGESSRKIVGDF